MKVNGGATQNDMISLRCILIFDLTDSPLEARCCVEDDEGENFSKGSQLKRLWGFQSTNAALPPTNDSAAHYPRTPVTSALDRARSVCLLGAESSGPEPQPQPAARAATPTSPIEKGSKRMLIPRPLYLKDIKPCLITALAWYDANKKDRKTFKGPLYPRISHLKHAGLEFPS